MTTQTTQELKERTPFSLSPRRIALIRVINSFVILAITLTLHFSAYKPDPMISTVIISTALGLILTSTLGYMLIRKEHTQLGLDINLYSFILGMAVISIFIDGIGLFIFVALLLLTPLSISTQVTPRRVSISAILSILFGGFALLLDINMGITNFRAALPPIVLYIIWFVTSAMVVAFAIFIYRQFPSFTLRVKIIASFIIVTLTAIIIFVLIANNVVKNLLTETANESLLSVASQAEDSIKDFISNTLINTQTESQLPGIVDYLTLSPTEKEDPIVKAKILRTVVALAGKNREYITSYAIMDLEGNVLVDTAVENVGTNRSDRDYFINAIANDEAYFSPITISPTTNQPSIYFSAPIKNFFGSQTIGVLRVRYNAQILQDIVETSNGIIGPDSYAVLLDEYHIIIAHGTKPQAAFTTVMILENFEYEQLKTEGRIPSTEDPLTELFRNLTEFEENLNSLKNSETGYVFFESKDISTWSRLSQVVAIDMVDPPWILVFFQPQDTFLQPLDRLTNLTLIINIIIIPLVILIAIGITQILTRPISRLTETARSITEGNLGVRVDINTKDEIGELANSFNTMTAQLQGLVTDLEGQVTERTRDLESRASLIRATAEVARDTASEVNLNDLLDRFAMLTADRFGFYHVGIYKIEKENDYAVLVAGSDVTGQQLTQDKHKYLLNSDSNVGKVCISGEAQIISEEDEEAQVSFHPLLPRTQAQLIIPLILGERVWGAVDIHSTNPKAFYEDDIAIFHTLVDQIAIAIDKAEIHQNIQQTLEELETAYKIFTKESWEEYISSKDIGDGYRYRNLSYEKISDPSPEVNKVWRIGEKTISNRVDKNEGDPNLSTIAVPMKVRGEIIGVLNLNINSDLVPTETSELIEEIAGRLSLILENARLVERAQSLVRQEQLTGHITNQIRQTLDMDEVLRSAAKEFGENLGLAEVEIRIGNFEGASQDKSNGRPENDTEIQPDTSELEE